MSVADAGAGRLSVSFECFPPKSAEAEVKLWETIGKLAPLNPDFVSVTYGAGGSTRDRTHRTVARLIQETHLKPAAHLTTVAASRGEVDGVLRQYWDAGVRHLVALRGDPPGGLAEAFTPHPDGYANATELVAAAKRLADFEISVGVYPEKHPESPSIEHDLDVIRAKIDAGASRGISQFFFEAETFLRFRDRLAKAGIALPIAPGIMPVTNFNGLRKMAAGCGAHVPPWLERLFEGLDDDPETRKLVAATTAAQLCLKLAEEGVALFHFYTLNRAELTLAACRMLGVLPEAKEQAA
ncbi:MAG: methylenetetrahydrofolate reductase [NAD(P)H] [Alphaproteobacteria bacterium]|jgi:methylenetetrahydrofolate reductase (NADPH)|nr:methylenetetrahydrofolate reductase [NAD(P)H] [Alphaproteobacteria bacterium]